MKAIFSALPLSIAFAGVAQAEVKSTKVRNETGIDLASEYSLSVSGRVTHKEVADEVAKRIRHEICRNGGNVDGWNMTSLSRQKAIRELGESDGQFEGIGARKIDILHDVIADRDIASIVYKMEMSLGLVGAQGSSVAFIFIPRDFRENVV